MTCRPKVIASLAAALSWKIGGVDARGKPSPRAATGGILEAELLPGGGISTAPSRKSAGGAGDKAASALLQTSEFAAFEVRADGVDHQVNASGLEKQDCRWNDWSPWSTCSRSCGLGTTERTRGKVGPFNGGVGCEGEAKQAKNCNSQPCPVDCVLGEWEPWSDCSVSCGGPSAPGKTQRTRSLLKKAEHGGKECEEDRHQMRVCMHLMHESCPTDCRWGDWGPYSKCSVTCGVAGGVRVRHREIAQQLMHTGKQCEGEYYQTEGCGKGPCEHVDCQWDDWQDWGACMAPCGEGQKVRVRDMLSRASENGHCPGTGVEQAVCEEKKCPEDCRLGDWGDWSSCPVLCGGGERTRLRQISREKHGGEPCPAGEEASEKDPCGMEECT